MDVVYIAEFNFIIEEDSKTCVEMDVLHTAINKAFPCSALYTLIYNIVISHIYIVGVNATVY